MIRPMLASLTEAPLTSANLVYEPKYDGIRAIVEIAPAKKGAAVRLWSRNGNEKTAQFPTVARALAERGAALRRPVVLDGELVALDEAGRPAGFQRLQGRIHLSASREVEQLDRTQRVALIVFDLLQDGESDLCRLPLHERRRRLEELYEDVFRPPSTRPRSRPTSKSGSVFAQDDVVRISEQIAGDARELHARATREGWEGLIAKDVRSVYEAGRRSPAWRKVKLHREQEFVVAGWTEPRQTRAYFGALLLGVYEGDALVYVGHTGTGFDQKELARVWKLLKSREVAASPFSERFKTNEPAHWARPELVAQIRFTEWTADRRLRHPVYLGLRDDKNPREIVREDVPVAQRPTVRPASSRPPHARPARGAAASAPTGSLGDPGIDRILDQLRALEDARRDGELTLPNGNRVGVTNLAKVFWPAAKGALERPVTKGDLLRYYVEVSPFLLPAVEDRPLVMKRFPNGIAGKAFYQQRSREERPPAGVRIERLQEGLDPIAEPDARRLVGGSLTTLVYMTQIAAISQDPWFSRVQSPLTADHVAIDLDPGPEATFARVLDVARWVRDELASLKVPGFPKTSGSRGLHIYIPLAPHTSYESGMLFCQIVATVVATRHPKEATVERMTARRPRGTVYVDFLQNILGKTLATAYSARASDYAGVSTPLAWDELDGALNPRDFTIRTAPSRFKDVGDLWSGLRSSKAADLEAVFRKYGR